MTKVAIVVFPGTNREKDMQDAFAAFGVKAVFVSHTETALPAGLDLLVFPGGFSYGDYLRCGAIAARAPIIRAAKEYAKKGGKIFGVCNGFQILCEAGFLPGVLTRNVSGRFVCKQVDLVAENIDKNFTAAFKTKETIRIPVAHGEGSYQANDETLRRLSGDGRILLTYQENFNGSRDAIAGVTDEKGAVFGMMPHPENAVLPHHASRDGRKFFESLLGL